MTGASKILTVSYGTFSCTLEGFDDPFSTMKAIAEYFRDLAADDRYFGAEPPVPDSAMLHRIAETATLRRVQAQVQDNGVVLRTGAAIDQNVADMAAANAAPAPALAPAPSVQNSDAAAGEMAEAAARLARLRAEIDEKAAHIAALEARAESVADNPAAAPAITAKVPPADTGNLDHLLDTKHASQENSDHAEFEVEESIPLAAINQSLIDAVSNTAAAEIAGDVAEDMALPADAAPTPPRVEPDQGIISVGAEATDIAAAPPQAPAAAETAPHPAPFRVEVLRGGQITSSPTSAPASEYAAPEFVAPEFAGNAPIDGDQAKPARTRIIRIRRVAKTSPAEPLPDTAQAAASPATGLSAEAEASLAAELAALDGTTPPLTPPPSAARAKINPSQDTLDKLLARANQDFADTNVMRRQSALSHMKAAVAATNADRNLGEDLGKDRLLNNFRATMDAVAPATATPNRASPLVLVSEQRIDPAGKAQPAQRGDAHLKLAPTPAHTNAKPENIFRATDEDVEFAGPQSNVFTGTETYEDFVDRLGAVEQIDLMEAAAVYVAHVEKQPLFRRRQLIRHMSNLPDALPVTRESSVMIFNQLLRKGHFAEMEPGLFAVTNRSPLLAEVLKEEE